ncbi:MAG: amidohydrolase family protein [Candidatus Sericytochromatia bacterium]|nr:amidohydrolase family protein [Candidatus Sericytochromatia bacterium]
MAIRLFSEHVILGQGANLRVEGALLSIAGDSIVDLQPMSRAQFAARPDADDCLDLGQQLVGPSFLNGHTHLAMSALRGIGQQALRGNVVEDLYFQLESHLTPADVRAFVRMGAYENLLAGVGAVWDHYYHADDIAAGLMDVGLCGVVAPTVQDVAGPGRDGTEAALESTLAIHASTRHQQAGVYAALGPHATDTVSPALWRRLALLADQHQLVMHAHIAQSIEEYRRSMQTYGCTPIAGLREAGILDLDTGLVLVHSLFVTAADIRLLHPDRHALAYCPLSQIQFAFPAHITPWLQAGLPIQVGTDAGACNDTMNVQQELRVLAGGSAFAVTQGEAYRDFQASGSLGAAEAVHSQRVQTYDQTPSIHQMLDMVWQTPARFCPALRMGELAIGNRACLNVWDLSHPALWPATDPLRALVMCDAAKALRHVMLNGQWMAPLDTRLQEHVLNSADFQAAQAEASERLQALLRRTGLF